MINISSQINSTPLSNLVSILPSDKAGYFYKSVPSETSFLFTLPNKSISKKTVNGKIARRRWNESELNHLRLFYGTNVSVKSIAKDLKRTEAATRAKAYFLKLSRPFRGLLAKNIAEQCKHLKHRKDGSIMWDNRAVAYLGALWERLYSPNLIAKILKTTSSAISEAARRSGLPSRVGLTFLSKVPNQDPLSAPINQVIKEQMIERYCVLTHRLFFLKSVNRKKQFYSYQANQIIARNSVESAYL